MGNYTSTSNGTSNDTKCEIEILLSQLHSKSSKNTNDHAFKQIQRHEVNLQKLQKTLDAMKDEETFKQFDTYQYVCHKMPIFVIQKVKINEDPSEIDHNFGAPTYYDVYGSDDTIKQVLISFLPIDIAEIISQYSGNGEFLFSTKVKDSGAMTLSTSQLFIGDALTISCTYSEKSGGGNSARVGKDYDKRLLMYLAFIVHKITETEISSSYRSWDSRIFRKVNFNFRAFMKYEILEKPRPPPKKRENVCIVGDCLVRMDSGLKAARHIRAGDYVKTSNGCLAKVLCTVTQRIEDVIEICKLGECYITPEHPIRKIGSGDWEIPYNVVEYVEMYVDQINNFVLESEHYVVVDNVECITLGHMFSDPVVKHPVWGTEVILDFLKSFPSYPDVVIDGTLCIEHLLRQEE